MGRHRQVYGRMEKHGNSLSCSGIRRVENVSIGDFRGRRLEVHDIQAVCHLGQQEIPEEIASDGGLEDRLEIGASWQKCAESADEEIDVTSKNICAANIDDEDGVRLHVPEAFLT